MVKRIELLPSDVINKIAAGEVLENPASAVKELVENSIDAEARTIDLEIKGGGQYWIRILDDGIGMNRADALDCLERHATSKIRKVEDLLKLSTMGFRGEALAAIASVSHMEIETCDGRETTKMQVEGGKVISLDVSARNRGTTIDVRSLFYNVPARLKFQKSISSSASGVLKTLQTLSLAHPEIAFSLTSQQEKVFKVAAEADWKMRAKDVLGEFAHEIRHEWGNYSIYGLIGAPNEAKGNRSGQYVFLNKRPIFSPIIAKAISAGYSTRLLEGKYPSVLLFLELPPDEFDVNVHPQKRDVRFQEESKVYQLVERAIAKAFAGAPEVSFASPLQFHPRSLPWDEELAQNVSPVVVQPEFPLPKPLRRKALALIGSFVLFEGELLDLKGAEARILLENLQKEKPDIQHLLLPFEIPLSSGEAIQGDKWTEELKTIGVEARFLGGKTLVVDALPVGVREEEVKDFLEGFKADRKLASLICRFCRSRKRIYTLEEAERIDLELKKCQDGSYDPLGRSLRKEMREEEVIKWFFQ